jgi:magnesium-protoporphyrin IX monomethyl ester (oxidative) cyclase
MYVRDHQRPGMHQAMGLAPTEFDYTVFRITSDIAKQVFPIEIDTDHPAFRQGMSRLAAINTRMTMASERGGVWGKLRQGWCALQAAAVFARVYCIPVKKQALPVSVRVQPTW